MFVRVCQDIEGSRGMGYALIPLDVHKDSSHSNYWNLMLLHSFPGRDMIDLFVSASFANMKRGEWHVKTYWKLIGPSA